MSQTFSRGELSLISAYLHPYVFASQVDEAEVLVLECEPPIQKGSYPMYAQGDLIDGDMLESPSLCPSTKITRMTGVCVRGARSTSDPSTPGATPVTS